jgi:hypothetical protein
MLAVMQGAEELALARWRPREAAIGARIQHPHLVSPELRALPEHRLAADPAERPNVREEAQHAR